MSSYRPELDTCPWCGAKGDCSVHAYYGRGLADFINGQPARHDITITRVVCSCGHTHAILPDIIIPYSGYGLFFILRVLAEYFLRLFTIEKLCERFHITAKQFYKWLKLWNSQKEEWLGMLLSMETSDRSFLCSLVRMPRYSDFAAGFVRRFSKSFLQSHKNPAAYCQQVFSP